MNSAVEQQALAMLRDNADVGAMSQPQLRKRLSTMRELLASGQLSPKTADALRAKLAAERQVLRKQVSGNTGGSEQQQGGGSTPAKPQGGGSTPAKPKPSGQSGSKGPDIDITIVLGDTRPPNVLRDDELVRRIDVYRVAAYDRRYSESERLRWRRQMEFDRRILRERMLAERRMREARLRSGSDVDINIVIGNDYTPARRPPPYVFAAEAEDDELVDVLAAPPRRPIDRRYSIDDFEDMPDARDAVARIEIDTVNFGFGEAFLREEEIDKLDRIARILEQILAGNPDEVFLIEGHTDAVGSEAVNLQLSRERARAVKDALTTFYVIPPENLETVGLGERYLKIPTDQPEAENRRVSLARITPLVGRVD
jgi:outer membrane protein OmpA-like peptidoglycan-associated protein